MISMNTIRRSSEICFVVALISLGALAPWTSTADADAITPVLSSEDPPAGGMRIFRMQLPGGQFRVYLPDDIRVGDRISGSLSYEPNAASPAETEQFLARFTQVRVEARFVEAGTGSRATSVNGDRFSSGFRFDVPAGVTGPLTLDLTNGSGADLGQVKLPVSREPMPGFGETPVAGHLFPGLAQAGRPLEIRGAFDGDSANTIAELDRASAQVLIESPRLLVVRSPAQTLGVTYVLVRDGGRQITGTTRNIGVGLSAPKLNLMKGETTVMTVRVTGLAGIRTDVPLWLVKAGTVVMERGDFQHLLIKPSEVRPDGSYETTRKLTGLVQGTFGVVATVIDPTVKPIVIPLIERAEINGYNMRIDGGKARFEVSGVLDPLTGKPLNGNHRLQADCGVPVLSKLPMIGMLFKNGSARAEKQECLVLITPRIVRTPD